MAKNQEVGEGDLMQERHWKKLRPVLLLLQPRAQVRQKVVPIW